MENTHIAVFPIPNCVTFPHTVFPLHVFEPRYRAMIAHCLEHDMLLGITHTEKEISPSKNNQSLQEALQSNQATYKPCRVFSAGYCELLSTTDDGRQYLNVHLQRRFELKDEVQTLPFNIYECQPYDDLELTPEECEQAEVAREKILNRLNALTAKVPEAHELITSSVWQQKTMLESSFALFGLLQLPAEIGQPVLEMRSPLQRLSMLLSILNQQAL